MPQIIILSDQDDAHIPFVTNHIQNVDIIVFDPRTISKGHELSYWINKGKITIVHKGIVLDSVIGFWYRKPQVLEKHELPVPDSYKEYSYDALKTHFLWLSNQFPKAVWMSRYYDLVKGGNKVLQLELASKLGLHVPDTLVTSNSVAARKFLQKHPATIIKPISNYGFSVKNKGQEEESTFFYANKVKRRQKISLKNLNLAPSIFQAAVNDIVGDLRINVIGQKVFASLITNPGFDENERIRDWRIGHETGTLKIEPFGLPTEIAIRCALFLKEQNLTFSAFDMILDKKGQIWFIENNPNGQWAFVEELTKQPIGREIAYFLSYGKNI